MRIDKDNIKIILILLVVCLSLGYAYINSDLNINGTAQVKHANWDIHWANVQVTNGSVTGSNVVTQPTISSGTTVNYSVILSLPGDYYEFTVDAVNGGQIDAMIDTIDSKLNGATITELPDYLNYTVTYEDGVELEQNHLLAANTTEKYKVRIEYKTDIELNQIPATNQNLTLQFTVTYRQANENAQEVDHPVTVYTANLYDWDLPDGNAVYIGQAIPNSITQYSSASEALTDLRTTTMDDNVQYYLKHTIQSGVVTESYVEFIVTPPLASANPGMTAGTYTLRGGIDESSITSPQIYEANKTTLLSAFGSSNCRDHTYNFFCGPFDLGINITLNGNAQACDNDICCSVFGAGNSYCSSTS